MAHTTERGTGTPPTSSLNPMRYHSASHRALNDFLKDSGSATVCVSGSKTGGVAVRIGERFAKRSLGQACDLCQHVADSVGIQVAPSASLSGFSSPRTSKRLNSRSRTLLL